MKEYTLIYNDADGLETETYHATQKMVAQHLRRHNIKSYKCYRGRDQVVFYRDREFTASELLTLALQMIAPL